MPLSMPSPALSEALARIGLEAKDQRRASLRTLVHRLTDEPPPVDSSADDLARTVLKIALERGLRDLPKELGRSQ